MIATRLTMIRWLRIQYRSCRRLRCKSCQPASKGTRAKEDTEKTAPSKNGPKGITVPEEGDREPKKAKPPKPDHPEFLELAKQAVALTPPTNGVKALQKILKAGVNAKTALGPLLNDLFALLCNWPDSSRLAL